MKKSFIILFALVMVVGLLDAFTHEAKAQSVRTEDNRRTIYNECRQISEVISVRTLPQYSSMATLTGRTQTTAGALGWDYVWNEVSAGKVCKTYLKPDAKIWVINGEQNPQTGYLEGCYHPTIKNFKNRVIPILKDIPDNPVQAKPFCKNKPGLTIEQAQLDGYIVDENGECTKNEPPPQQVYPECPNPMLPLWNPVTRTCEARPEPQKVYPCAVVNAVAWGTKGFGARLPNWKEWLLGPGKAAATAALGSNYRRVEAAVLSGTISAADTVLLNMLIPDKNYLFLTTTDGPVGVKKKKSASTPGGKLLVVWKDGQIIGTAPTGEICFTAFIQESLQFGSDAIIFRRSGGSSTTLPIKSQTQAPDRTTGQVPTGQFPVGTVGYCTRPRVGVPNATCRVTEAGVISTGATSTSSSLPVLTGGTTTTTTPNRPFNTFVPMEGGSTQQTTQQQCGFVKDANGFKKYQCN
jgi:hypothetical protein